jgi:hypothetical protein
MSNNQIPKNKNNKKLTQISSKLCKNKPANKIQDNHRNHQNSKNHDIFSKSVFKKLLIKKITKLQINNKYIIHHNIQNS